MKPFTLKEKVQIKETYGSMKKYREFLFEEVRRNNHLRFIAQLEGSPTKFFDVCERMVEELYKRSFLKGGR